MWILAALSIVTVFQRVLAVRGSEGARDIIVPPAPSVSDDGGVEPT
jgi:CDP-diacylglycerol--glycerol-3-phosphate 3-phosphatidyltransferase